MSPPTKHDQPLRRARGTSDAPLNLTIEDILNLVTEPGKRMEKRGRQTRTALHPFLGGDAVNLCRPEHRTPEKAQEAAQAVRVLQKIAAQCADAKRRRGRKRKGIWLTPEEVEVWNGLLRHQPTLQFNSYNPETHEREAHPGRENQVAGAHWPHPEAVFHTRLYLAAQFVADVADDRGGHRVVRCRAPLHPANTEDKTTCGRLFVTATQGGTGQTCSDTCRRRAKDRKRALERKAREAERKEGYEELRRRVREARQKDKA